MMIADCLTKAMSATDLLGVLEEGMLRKIDLTSDYSIKVVSLYAPVAYVDKESDESMDMVTYHLASKSRGPRKNQVRKT